MNFFHHGNRREHDYYLFHILFSYSVSLIWLVISTNLFCWISIIYYMTKNEQINDSELNDIYWNDWSSGTGEGDLIRRKRWITSWKNYCHILPSPWACLGFLWWRRTRKWPLYSCWNVSRKSIWRAQLGGFLHTSRYTCIALDHLSTCRKKVPLDSFLVIPLFVLVISPFSVPFLTNYNASNALLLNHHLHKPRDVI